MAELIGVGDEVVRVVLRRLSERSAHGERRQAHRVAEVRIDVTDNRLLVRGRQ
jgi:hypothetical protein